MTTQYNNDIQEALYEAQLQERYDEMCELIQILIKSQSTNGKEIDYETRNALSDAYKRWIEEKIKVLDKTDDENNDNDIIKNEIVNKCMEILNLIQKYIMKNIRDKESEMEAFFLILQGDYNRILSEFCDNNETYKNVSKTSYIKAMELVKKILNFKVHPTYFKVVIGYSTLLYEVLNEKEQAFELAKEEFSIALAELDKEQGGYKDTTFCLQVIYDNIKKWEIEIRQMKRDEAIKTVNGYMRETQKYILSLPDYLTIPDHIQQICFHYYYIDEVEFKINS